jgi:ketosteroid isomerase-like protein
MSRENVELVRASLEAFARGDLDAALEMGHPELVSTRVDPDGSVHHGPDGFRDMLAEWLEGFNEWSYSIDEPIEAGERVVVRMEQSGRGAASGVPVHGEYWMVYEVRDALISKLDIYADRDRAFAAAGLASG